MEDDRDLVMQCQNADAEMRRLRLALALYRLNHVFGLMAPMDATGVPMCVRWDFGAAVGLGEMRQWRDALDEWRRRTGRMTSSTIVDVLGAIDTLLAPHGLTPAASF